jgi:Tol biopolymer transport system component
MLSHYRLVEKIGEGGMGVVWKAEDTKLDRAVAVKILPAAFAEDTQRLARFEREAKLLATLNHPNVAAIYGFDSADGIHFLVLELIEGLTLSQMTEGGPLSVEEALDTCRQVAEGLEAAHTAGVIHRDLKPGNVIVTADGKAKVLDFGLAKGIEGTSGGESGSDLSMSPTVTFGGTQAGMVLGTAPYMSPEQARGKPLDKRTDIWSFGCLLHECLTGQRAFAGETVTDTLSAILQNDPDWNALPDKTPRRIRELLERCLEKSPRNRLHDIADARIELDRVVSGREWTTSAIHHAAADFESGQPSRLAKVSLVAAGVLLGTLATALLMPVLKPEPPARQEATVLRAEMVVPPGTGMRSVLGGHVALSPDARYLAYRGGYLDGTSMLMVRNLRTGEVRGVAGTEGATFPFWSSDGRWLAFFADEKLKKIDAGGGPVQTLAEAHAGRGGTWNRDGTLVFAPDIRGPLLKVSENGGAAEPVTSPAHEDVTHRMPHFLPGGQQFLFVQRDDRSSEEFGDIAVGSVDGMETRVVLETGSNPQYADNYLFFVRDGNLVAQRLDLETLATEGMLIPLADAVEYFNPRDIGNYSVSDRGLLIYRKREVLQSQLGRFDFDGNLLEVFSEPGHFSPAAVAADGKLVALNRLDPSSNEYDVWVLDLERNQMTRATFASSQWALNVAFAPDGRRMVVSNLAGAKAGSALWIQSLSGGASREMILESAGFRPVSWSSDGRYLLGVVQESGTAHDVAYIDLQEEAVRSRALVSTPFNEFASGLSPDGRWAAYMSNETGRFEVYLTDFPAAGRKWKVSSSGGSNVLWRTDGAELYFQSQEGVFAISLSVEDPGSLRLGEPRLVIDHEKLRFADVRGPLLLDGQTALALKRDSSAGPEPLRLIRNWKLELER